MKEELRSFTVDSGITLGELRCAQLSKSNVVCVAQFNLLLGDEHNSEMGISTVMWGVII